MKYTYDRMNGWIGGWMDGWMGGWMDGWVADVGNGYPR